MPGFNPDKLNIHELAIEEPEVEQGVIFDQEKNVTKDDWEKMKGEIEKDKQYKLFQHLGLAAMAMKILDPKMDFNIDSSDWPRIMQELEERKKTEIDLDMAANIKIINPDIDLRYDQSDWQRMIDGLEFEKKNGVWVNVCIKAMQLKILAAKKVEVTDRGLELTMSEKRPLQTETPEMPEQRNF